MSATISLTEVQVLTALRTFLLSIMQSGVEVIRAEINRVPEPEGSDFLIMTPTLRGRIGTNVDTYSGTIDSAPLTLLNVEQSTQTTVQIDIHGPNGAENAQIVSSLLRDYYACASFASSGFAVQPLYASDPIQTPFINGEQQYEFRWTVDAVLQANPVVTVIQQFADTLTPTLIEADALS